MCLTLVAVVLSPLGCASDDGDDGSDEMGDGDGTSGGDGDGDGDGGGEGVTPCGMFGDQAVSCQAGQYCADSVLALCENGCLNNDNCASDQVCEKAQGEDEGTCQNTDSETTGETGPTEEEFCEKLLVCDPTGTMAQCSTVYVGTNAGCHQCIVDGNCGDINDGSCDEACGI